MDEKGWKIYQHSNQMFNLQNILSGNIEITSKWDRNAKKHNPVTNEQINENEVDNVEYIQKDNIENSNEITDKDEYQTVEYDECYYSDEEEESYTEYE